MDVYDIHDDKSYQTVIAIALSIGITIVAISLRLLARKFNRIPLGIDDYLILLGAVCLFTSFRLGWRIKMTICSSVPLATVSSSLSVVFTILRMDSITDGIHFSQEIRQRETRLSASATGP